MALLLLQSGPSYRITALVTNRSTKGGTPVAATFTIEWRVGLLKKPLLPTPCGSIGDVNEDGVVAMGDVTLIEMFMLGALTPTPEQILRADVDGNGEINMGDITQIERFILGADTIFWVCALPPPAGRATVTLLDILTRESFAPGEQRSLNYVFSVPYGIVEDMGLAQVTVLAEGKWLAKGSQPLEVAATVGEV